MNYLQLVNDFMVETNMEDQIATVIGQIDDGLKATTWVKDAWIQIQRAERWSFMWSEGSFPTVANQAVYSLANQNRVNGDSVDIYSYRIPASKRFITPIDLNLVRFEDNTGSPTRVAEYPDGSIRLSPVPDAIHTVKYDLWAAPVVLASDFDVPSMPPQWHKIIVWRSIVNYAREQGKEWTGLYTAATREFNHMYADMQRQYLPPMGRKVPLTR